MFYKLSRTRAVTFGIQREPVTYRVHRGLAAPAGVRQLLHSSTVALNPAASQATMCPTRHDCQTVDHFDVPADHLSAQHHPPSGSEVVVVKEKSLLVFLNPTNVLFICDKQTYNQDQT